MNTSTLPLKAFLASLAAVALLPVGPAAAAFAFTSAGLISILLSDYGRAVQPVSIQAQVIPFGGPVQALDQAA